MKEIIIIPHIGIGQLKLGMAPDELENALLQMKKQWSNSSDEAMQMECCAETDDPNLITGRYMDNASFFLVQYRNGKATEIGIQRELSKVASIKLFGLDMFNTTAECIIDSLMKKDNVICNEKDLQLGTEYFFPKQEYAIKTYEKPDKHLCRPAFLIIKTIKEASICHFRNKLDADQPDFILRIVITQFIHRVIYFVCCRLLEVIINIVQMVFIHNFLQEVINIQLGS